MSDGASGTSARHDNIGRGILFALIAVLTFGIQDAVAKILVQSYSPFHITMMRFWAFAAFSLFLVARQGPLGRRCARSIRGCRSCAGCCSSPTSGALRSR